MSTATANILASLIIVAMAYATAYVTMIQYPRIYRSERTAFWMIAIAAFVVDCLLTYAVLANGIGAFLR